MSTDVSEVRAASIIRALMMEAERTPETSVDIQLSIRQYIPEDFELHTRRRENLKSHKSNPFLKVQNDRNSVTDNLAVSMRFLPRVKDSIVRTTYEIQDFLRLY
jgi:hypothetical protein